MEDMANSIAGEYTQTKSRACVGLIVGGGSTRHRVLSKRPNSARHAALETAVAKTRECSSRDIRKVHIFPVSLDVRIQPLRRKTRRRLKRVVLVWLQGPSQLFCGLFFVCVLVFCVLRWCFSPLDVTQGLLFRWRAFASREAGDWKRSLCALLTLCCGVLWRVLWPTHVNLHVECVCLFVSIGKERSWVQIWANGREFECVQSHNVF